MSTQVIQIDSARVDIDAIHRAGDVLRDGGLVGFPTETVYGLGARADDAAAVTRLREVKGREVRKGFTVHIASRDDVKSFAPRMTGLARRFVRKGWPGPLTLIVSVEDPASVPIMAGRDGAAAEAMYFENTIGLRCPDDPVAHELLRAVGATQRQVRQAVVAEAAVLGLVAVLVSVGLSLMMLFAYAVVVMPNGWGPCIRL